MKFAQPLLLSLALFAAFPSHAAPDSAELDNIRKAIASAQKDLSAKQAARRQANATLNRTQSQLAQARLNLDSLTRRQQDAWQKLQALEDSLTQLQADIANSKAQIARLLVSNYKNHQPNAVAIMLKNMDSNQRARFLNYTRRINAANDQVIKDLGVKQGELGKQEQAVNAELARLRRLAAAQQQRLRRLGQENSQAMAQSKALNDQIAERQNRIAQLKAEEQRLNQILAQISAKQTENKRTKAANGKLTQSDLALQPENPNSGSGSLKGRLPLPAAGKLVGTYGSLRSTGGTWRGLFIAAPLNTSVNSVGSGQVVYTGEAIKNAGNTVIIDHGGDYKTVYMGLSTTAVSAGSRVVAGQNIGTSGTLSTGEQGVYFELRYRNAVMNPRSIIQ
ncbi:peptidoglycan DD-metalloendopeptidase family protein [Kingella negevensis]|uniref:Murein hydrolase activator EnvC n=1 Tax=Kingella negevensis TaxID=1522312 RepID=A0A238TEZ3_9NEIS|nr:peptidoglycan DD-metalloendopeptidase family protein [Kingella negevensis]MDK4680943.1 peptidoglycan DD-metalloendopeptidase family protein [Kingella negevensis]MDK4683145.1 peptidoglycan DD-metalloendopeptidase family protein [Kingella negevensis]MDK4691723.1 peptidoglycan DD-metalloendopeptidase family protein [Kingella negevensis]MDK4693125.1 peptidoglycan DD-metalloendopeptidase family protein [Kingella negevensis]MDK4698317.1 peptidoglycan DD-metalloendopeptidase family protein [Kingel